MISLKCCWMVGWSPTASHLSGRLMAIWPEANLALNTNGQLQSVFFLLILHSKKMLWKLIEYWSIQVLHFFSIYKTTRFKERINFVLTTSDYIPRLLLGSPSTSIRSSSYCPMHGVRVGKWSWISLSFAGSRVPNSWIRKTSYQVIHIDIATFPFQNSIWRSPIQNPIFSLLMKKKPD